MEHSPDHKTIAYSTDVKGSEYFEIRFRDVESGTQLPDVLVNCSAHFCWAADSNQVPPHSVTPPLLLLPPPLSFCTPSLRSRLFS